MNTAEWRRAIETCAWQCRYCDSDAIIPREDCGELIADTEHDKVLALLEFVDHGKVAYRWDWCPSLEAGSDAMWQVWFDVNTAIKARLADPDADATGVVGRYSRRVA